MPKKSSVGWKMLNVLKAVCIMDKSVTEVSLTSVLCLAMHGLNYSSNLKEANTTAVLEDLQIEPGPAQPSLKRANVTFEGTLTAPPKRSRRMSIDEVEETVGSAQVFPSGHSAVAGDFVADLDFVANFA